MGLCEDTVRTSRLLPFNTKVSQGLYNAFPGPTETGRAPWQDWLLSQPVSKGNEEVTTDNVMQTVPVKLGQTPELLY